MAIRYWVGNSGSWTDTGHWSAASGGAGGAGVPNSTTDVVFDSNSFSSPAQIVSVTTAVDCKTFSSATVTNLPSIDFNTATGITLTGSMNFTGLQFTGESITAVSFPSQVTFQPSGTGATLTTGGTLMPLIQISNSGTKDLTLTDDLTFIQAGNVSLLFLLDGTFTFTTAAHNITAWNLLAFSLGSGVLNFDNSTITVNNIYQIGPGMTVSSNGTTYRLNGQVLVDGTGSPITLGSTSSFTVSSPAGVAVYHTAVNNSTATSDSGALSRIIIDPGEDPGRGGGSPPGPNPGWRVITRRYGTPTHFP